MRNRGPETDCEQNSLRYFCTAKGGCHIAGDGGREPGLRAWALGNEDQPSSSSADIYIYF